MAPVGLTLVATPIGNLGDVSSRALDYLRTADLIACEDTRVSGKLLARFDIKTRRLSYHEHNAERMRPQLQRRLEAGERIVLISDAGTPLINDPGYRLVQDCVEAGIPVTSAPGAAAPITALILSGLPSDRFLFAGFLPNKTVARRRVLAEFAELRATLVFFDSPRRITDGLADALAELGDRRAAIAREMTKRHEEVLRGRLSELVQMLSDREPLKGEIVLVIAPPEERSTEIDPDALDAQLRAALANASLRDAVRLVSEATGQPRRSVYDRALKLAEAAEDDG